MNPIRLNHSHHTVVKWIGAALLAAMILLPLGCAKRAATSVLPGPNEAWDKAKSLMARERYFKAQELLRDIVLNYSGSSIVDSAQFMLGLATYELRDYLIAADEFHRVIEQYPFSKLIGNAVYYEALSDYRQSPVFALDQALTDKALRGFQRFLEEYPGHALTDSGYFYLGQCREKLGRKEYASAKLYYDLGEFASAIIYCDVIRDNYYDTSLAGPALFLKGRCYFAVKDWPRARKELEQYLQKYPDGNFAVRVRDLLGQIAHRGDGSTSATTP